MVLAKKELQAVPYKQAEWTNCLLMIKVPLGFQHKPMLIINVYVQPDIKIHQLLIINNIITYSSRVSRSKN